MNYLSPYMYGDPNFRVTTTSKSKPMAPVLIASLVSAGAGLLNSILGAIGSNDQQKLAIDNQWDMFNAQKDYQTSVNDKAMAFQREVNQMNMDWNTESNVRQRIEDAGYNPYLYQNGAMSANVNGSVPLSSSVSAPSPAVLPNPLSSFSSSFIDSVKGISDIMLAGQQSRSIAADADTKSYMLGRQKTKDNYVMGGVKLPINEAQQAYYKLDAAISYANQQAAIAAVQRLNQILMESPAYDENSQPITDESGNQLNMYQAQGRVDFLKSQKEVDLICKQLSNVDSQTALNKVEKNLKEFNLKYLSSAQLALIHATINHLASEIKKNQASTKLINSQFDTECVERQGLRLSNRLQQLDIDNYDWDKWFRRIGLASQSVNHGASAFQNAASGSRLLKLAAKIPK